WTRQCRRLPRWKSWRLSRPAIAVPDAAAPAPRSSTQPGASGPPARGPTAVPAVVGCWGCCPGPGCAPTRAGETLTHGDGNVNGLVGSSRKRSSAARFLKRAALPRSLLTEARRRDLHVRVLPMAGSPFRRSTRTQPVPALAARSIRAQSLTTSIYPNQSCSGGRLRPAARPDGRLIDQDWRCSALLLHFDHQLRWRPLPRQNALIRLQLVCWFIFGLQVALDDGLVRDRQ